ncbi:N-6 DNA methylase [Histophilus somni]|uniref:N-6 DNA methylase n=4 Tax=Histophilus somni TaxID=731 RepID=UPI000B3B8AC7|nr:N-6 DNA methylase [Histophilus somni]ARU67293.1 DNA methyltransferase [Histophilus somni]
MITKHNLPELLNHLGFTEQNQIYRKVFHGQYELSVDFKAEKIHYPNGLTAERDTTLNFSQPENFVVLECVCHLLQTSYTPNQIVLEPKMTGGREDTSFYCDILLRDNDHTPYMLIECKTTDNSNSNSEFEKAWRKMQKDGGQLFNYFNSYRKAQYLCLYASDWNGENVEHSYRLVSMKDNTEYLKSDEKLIGYEQIHAESGSKSDFFEVWKNTYQLDATEHQLFESAPFNIGTRPFSASDLKVVDNTSIQKKYHQFATIMRQHNVSGRENAFDKLVNLFLAKIKDESENPNELKVYWKGAAQDNYFDLQDRLQALYKKGMDEFLGEEITHVTKEEIEAAFILFKNKKDETKKTILDKFTEIKYYTNNDFAFLDVHNKKLFFQNGAILKEVVQMLQDIRLKTDNGGENQFLGDLFEGFLDQGVKQSEGQFFTPLPIVRFLVSSLPLADLISGSDAPPKMIDYACGAGHFLNEYASQIRPLVQAFKQADTAPYYQAIVGIEKEYRLSKVAKVSAFMYGQDGIQIVYGDGLTAHNDKVKVENGAFSVLVANPPYSVKGFLDTLSDDECKSFSLYKHVDKTDTFNSIETFFIERTAQLLQQNGVAAIILPSSVLSNGNIYIKAREILLQHFDIVAIAEFGSGTFGKTGTNTVTLFLRRKSDAPSLSAHYQNRVDFWFSNDKSADELFQDAHLLQQYCQHCGLNWQDYQDFLTFRLPESGIFADYRETYRQSTDWKQRQAKRDYKALSDTEKADLFEQSAWAFAREMEKDKLHYFLLAYANPQPVLIIKSPADNKEAKKFLGYEWSTRKGSEGIKYIGSSEAENEENPNRNQGIFKMHTPLFNPNDLHDSSKLNHLIRQNFQAACTQTQPEISEDLRPFASLRPLHEMLDFSRTVFDKAIQTALVEKVEISSKFTLVKLKDLAHIVRGVTYAKNEQVQTPTSNIILPADNISLDGRLNVSKQIYLLENKELDDEKRLKANDIFICFSSGSKKHVGKLCLIPADTNYYAGGFMGILRCLENIHPAYLFNILNLEEMRNQVRQLSNGNNIKNLSSSIGEIKIPLPPLDIQQQIIAECQKIDQEYETSRMAIETYRAKIAQIFSDLEVLAQNSSRGGGVKLFKIKDLCKTNPSKNILRDLPDDLIVSFVEMASVSNDGYIQQKINRPLGELRKSSYTYFQENDIIIAKITPCMENGKCALATELSNHIGMGSSEFHVIRSQSPTLNNAFLFHFLNRNEIRQSAEQHMTGASGHRRVPIGFYESLPVPVPSIEKQTEILAQIAQYEAQIATCEQKIQSLPAQKQAILVQYLQ